MLPLSTWLALFIAVAAHTGAAICYKKAAQQAGWRTIAIFVLGNAIGFFNPIFKTMALRNNNPNVIFAIMGGPGGILFIFVINWVFRGRLTRFQWFAILIIIVGSMLLQIQPGSSE
jgi:multidrug transporter EmrE-like cation transporter